MITPSFYALIVVTVIFIVYLYVAYYLRVHPSMSLLQASVDKVDYDMLNNKLPIVITDRIVDIHELLLNVFRYQYTFIQSPTTPQNQTSWLRNSHKFAVLRSNTNDKVQLAHPSSKMDTDTYEYMDVVLRKNQVLILPYGWWVLARGADVFMLDDMVSKLLSYVA